MNQNSQKFNENDSRLRLIYLYQLLKQHTDPDHPLDTYRLQAMMQEQHGIPMHRTTVSTDIDLLRTAGFQIGMTKPGKKNQYYIEQRDFELLELKILIDAVESSKFITEKQSRALVKKMISLTSDANAAKLKRHLHTSGRVKSENEKGYYIVDTINEAINARKRISFYYTDFDGRKRRFRRNDGRLYTVSQKAERLQSLPVLQRGLPDV